MEWAAWITELPAALARGERASPLFEEGGDSLLPAFSLALNAVTDEATAIIEGSVDYALAGDIIEVHGAEAATVARDNARAAALGGQSAQAKSWISQGARDHPAAGGR